MHLYIITRGIKKDVDDFITQLQGKYLPFKWRAKKEDPMQDMSLQVSVRPIQLWEIAYPKEHHALMCKTILGEKNELVGNDGTKGCQHKWSKKFLFALRKMLKLDPIGKYHTDLIMPISKQNMSVIGIGTKQDYTMETGVEGI